MKKNKLLEGLELVPMKNFSLWSTKWTKRKVKLVVPSAKGNSGHEWNPRKGKNPLSPISLLS